MTTAIYEFKANGKNYHYEVNITEVPAGPAAFREIKKIYQELGIKKATHQQFTFTHWNFWVDYIL